MCVDGVRRGHQSSAFVADNVVLSAVYLESCRGIDRDDRQGHVALSASSAAPGSFQRMKWYLQLPLFRLSARYIATSAFGAGAVEVSSALMYRSHPANFEELASNHSKNRSSQGSSRPIWRKPPRAPSSFIKPCIWIWA